ncbi:hypothetical protein ACJMK2_039014, partial [Sinanodonta woodiana]
RDKEFASTSLITADGQRVVSSEQRSHAHSNVIVAFRNTLTSRAISHVLYQEYGTWIQDYFVK